MQIAFTRYFMLVIIAIITLKRIILIFSNIYHPHWRIFSFRIRNITINTVNTEGLKQGSTSIAHSRMYIYFCPSWLAEDNPYKNRQCPKKPSWILFPNPLKNISEIQCQSTSLFKKLMIFSWPAYFLTYNRFRTTQIIQGNSAPFSIHTC